MEVASSMSQYQMRSGMLRSLAKVLLKDIYVGSIILNMVDDYLRK